MVPHIGPRQERIKHHQLLLRLTKLVLRTDYCVILSNIRWNQRNGTVQESFSNRAPIRRWRPNCCKRSHGSRTIEKKNNGRGEIHKNTSYDCPVSVVRAKEPVRWDPMAMLRSHSRSIIEFENKALGQIFPRDSTGTGAEIASNHSPEPNWT